MDDETTPGDAPDEELPETGDALPDDLDVSTFVGPYQFPNNNRRRIPGYIYLGLGAVCIAVWGFTRGGDPVLVNDGVLYAGLALVVVAGYHFLAGVSLELDEKDALVGATSAVGFPVGHASAQMGWRGLRSRPTWRVLVYSADEPPTKRGLVLIDGVDGEIIDQFVEDNPEDWTQFQDD
ncbi:MAG: hypothetical protein JNK12_24035 [Acidimicrobiales bacterium]|nr:hypothetical protein [Acidimicrobiales bacterium]